MIGSVGDGGEHDDEGHAEEAQDDREDTGHYGLRAHEVVSAEVAILTVPGKARRCLELKLPTRSLFYKGPAIRDKK